ncbi:hypothetical protein F5Y01DRAFT_328626 [Xylaria sp. FL0043]|nr:hypothetical protein F5Y01DRAFT_328626 [Xylaria sp. FL0043]
MDPLAIIGFSFKLPGGTVDENSLWDVVTNGKNLMTEWPKDRGILNPGRSGDGSVNVMNAKGGYFIDEDLGSFDAAFFSITATEATSMSPQHRWALEAVYHALENAGIPMESLRGSQTGVVGASCSEDFLLVSARDPDNMPRHMSTGCSSSLLPNRISWFFDLHGPSIHVDTACSSSMAALDVACQVLHSGDASAMIIIGTNLMLSPESSLSLSSLGFLSPDSKCFSFDARANGYSRGEGIVAMVIKPLPLAVQNGDTIRAVIRASASNQDGRTPSLTQPDVAAQEALIRKTYEKAGLPFDETSYLEAHGTGTPVGDPIEVAAISNAFRSSRSRTRPLIIGSIKANIGHLEGASGLAGLVKSVLALEKGVIPRQALFEKINPNINADYYKIQVPTCCIPWPISSVRRISVNSFGFGGSNSHAILDDAYSYLRSRRLAGFHNTRVSPKERSCIKGSNNSVVPDMSMSKLLVWTAADRNTLDRMLQSYNAYLSDNSPMDQERLSRLAYTLSGRRSVLSWRAFVILEAPAHVHVNNNKEGDVIAPVSKILLLPGLPMRAATSGLGAVFAFTGQGAQYRGMGLRLIRQYPIFKQSLQRSNESLEDLGCGWSVLDALQGEGLQTPKLSQPLCTILQIALVDLMSSFGIAPRIVIGHSSGEIAAAYAAGALSLESACKVAYFRGIVADKLLKESLSSETEGLMLAVTLTVSEVKNWLCKLPPEYDENAIQIACFNSPTNNTLSGPATAINKLKTLLEQARIPAKFVNTGVAYHSGAMHAVADEYLHSLGALVKSPETEVQRPRMISTVTGDLIDIGELTDPQYWVDNLVSPVKFSEAIQRLLRDVSFSPDKAEPHVSDIIEIGPHAALQKPIMECISHAESSYRYFSLLHRTKNEVISVQELVGMLFCHGYHVSILGANDQTSGDIPCLLDCPPYPFDHTRSYWTESRLSRNFRFRKTEAGLILGNRVIDWNPFQPRWRSWLSIDRHHWLGDHVVNNTVICPAAAHVVMIAEAISDIAAENGAISPGILLQDLDIPLPVKIDQDSQVETEVELQLQPYQKVYDKFWTNCDVQIFSHDNKRTEECLRTRAKILNDVVDASNIPVDGGQEMIQRSALIRERMQQATLACDKEFGYREFYIYCEAAGVRYGSSFQLLRNIRWDSNDTAVATLDVNAAKQGSSQIKGLMHPAILDACCQLLFLIASNGFIESLPTLVPRKIKNAWISSCAWTTTTRSLFLRVRLHKGTSAVIGTSDAIADDGSVVFSFEHIELVHVTAVDSSHSNSSPSRDLLFNIAWKPQYSSLSLEAKRKLCHSSSVTLNEEASVAKFRDFYRLMRIAADRALRTSGSLDIASRPGYFRQYVAYLNRLRESEAHPSEFDSLLCRCEQWEPEMVLVPAAANALPAILSGETNPLELFFQTDLAKRFYARMYQYHRDDKGLISLLDLLSHENPSIKIIEVGAGTGGMTHLIFDALREIERQTGQSRFVEYAYTDLSPSFFQQAKAEFPDPLNRIVFHIFDITRDPLQQGLTTGEYDVVIAGSVLHATADLARTLANVRQLLKPGGILVFQEITNPDCLVANTIFGCLEGWWLSQDSWRQKGPLLSIQQWDRVLLETGLFQGVELIFGDSESPECHLSSVLVSSAAGSHSSVERETKEATARKYEDIAVLIQRHQCQQRALALTLIETYPQLKITYIDEVLDGESELPLVVCLVDCGRSWFAAMGETEFKTTQALIRRTKNMIWVSSLASMDGLTFDPHTALASGFMRSIRSEHSDKKIVSLTIEPGLKDGIGSEAGHICAVLESCFLTENPPCDEVEFSVRNGDLVIGRLIREPELDKSRLLHTQPEQRHEAWWDEKTSNIPVVMDIEKPGMLDSIRFTEDSAHDNDLAPDHVEIQASMWPVSFRDVFVALGKLGDEKPGYECAGTITQVGSRVSSHLQSKDRVIACSIGSMRSHPRVPADAIFRVPDQLSLEDTAASITGLTTAYHSLVNVARLQSGEKILIHSAAGSTGQMAVQIALNLGAEVFATVGSDEKKELIQQKFNLPDTHIFYSRDTSFAMGVKRVTGSVDVVLNSLSGISLQASWECIAPYGRFIELGKADIVANSALSMAQFAKNVTFSAVDLHHTSVASPKLHRSIVAAAIDLLATGKVLPPAPLHFYPVSEAEKAFRYIQSGKNTGRTLITLDASSIVPKFLTVKEHWKFNPAASYLIAGGFGGIGRAIIRWMAARGARKFIILSRSGPTGKKALALISELEDKGIRVFAEACDLSSEAQLSAALECCVDMHPIKGCINAAMALQDSTFGAMSHAQWACTIQSKVNSSWVLHSQLPRDMDFFILLSSLSGIYGSAAQSNYAAGCAFQDSLARARTVAGFRTSVSLDLGWMRTIGIIAESHDLRRRQLSLIGMQPVSTPDFFAVLEHYLNPDAAPIDQDHCQLLIGATHPARFLAEGRPPPASLLNWPLLAGFSLAPSSVQGGQNSGSGSSSQNAAWLFSQSKSTADRRLTVTSAIKDKVARALWGEPGDVDPQRGLSDYGVDSLMAIEFRSWIRRDFHADITVFEIIGEPSIESIVGLILERTEV